MSGYNPIEDADQLKARTEYEEHIRRNPDPAIVERVQIDQEFLRTTRQLLKDISVEDAFIVMREHRRSQHASCGFPRVRFIKIDNSVSSPNISLRDSFDEYFTDLELPAEKIIHQNRYTPIAAIQYELTWSVGGVWPNGGNPAHTQHNFHFVMQVNRNLDLSILPRQGNRIFLKDEWINNKLLVGTELGYAFEHPYDRPVHISATSHEGSWRD